MRFRMRLSAAILAMVMMVSSIQIPGGISYAAEMADSGIESEQNVSVLTAEYTEDTEGGEESSTDEGAIINDESLTSSDNLEDGDEKTGDDNPASDDSQTDNENVSEDETDAGQVSDDDAEEPILSVDTEESETEETEVVEAEIEGAYQFGDMPSVSDAPSASDTPSAGGEIPEFSISTYEDDDSVEDYVYQQMLQRADCIDLYEGGFNNVSPSDLGSLVSGVLNEHPDLYFVSKRFSYGYGSDFETIRYLYMTYITDYDDVAFKKKTAAALACVTDGMSDDVKAIALHDYLVINVEYDYDNYLANSIPTDSYNAYGALVNGTAVCNGYALAYKYLLNQVGIECYMVTSPSMNHGWNMVKLDGEYYHVDTTWDDPTWDMVGKVCHTNLFRSDANFGKHYGWTITSGSSEVAYTATDTKYENAFWVDCTSPLVIDGTDCYYISKTEMGLKKASFSNIDALGTDVVSVGIWMNGSGGYWLGAYSGLYMINGRLFYNDENSIYSIKPDGTDKKTEFTPEKTGSNQIYYSAYRNGKVVYALQTSPNLSGKQTVLTAEIEGVNEPETPPQDVGLNAENPDCTFTTLDDETVSSIADGKPKVLFFFTPKCGRCLRTHKNLSEYIEAFDGVDIYAIEAFIGSTKEEVAEFKKEYGCDEITYCYDKDEKNSSRVWRYAHITGMANSSTPYIFFIDSENRVQYASAGETSWMDILECLQKYCGYGEVAYKITYELNGGTNDSANPGTYTPKETITLADAVRKEGYIFMGWYMDAEFNKRVKQIVTGSSVGDITLYAKWEEETYKITYELNGGANNEDNPSTYTVETEAIVLKDATPRAGYEFESWYKDAEFEEKVTEIPEGSTGDITLYAKWTKIGEGLYLPNFDYTYAGIDGTTLSSRADGKPKLLVFFSHYYGDCKETMQNITEDIYSFSGVDVYAIDITLSHYVDETKSTREYKDAYGCDEIKFVYATRDYPTNYNKAIEYQQAGYQHAEGLTASMLPLICYIDKDNMLQWVSNYEQTSGQILANLKKYCGYYTPEEQGIYKITYKLNGGTNDSANPDTYTSETETITLKDAVKDGYKFDGWYKDADFREKVTEIVKGSTGNITLYAKWRKIGLNAENPYYTFKTLDDETVSSRADGKPKVLFFFRQSASYCQDMSQDLSQHIEYFNGVDIYAIEVAKATREVVAQFKSVYGCDEITFCYDTGDTNLQCYYDYVDIAGFDYSGVPFAVYIDSQNRVQYAELGGVSYTKVLAYLRDYCDYRYEDSEGTYNINYKLDGGTNSSENPATYTSETETITLKDAVKEGFIFEGWYTDAAFTESSKLTEIVKGSKGNITLYAKWKKAEMNVSIQKPDKTTYKAGQTLDVTGGKVILTGKSDESVKVEKDITLSMISGFDSSAAGICNVIVTCDGYTGNFDVLIVEEPELIASYGQKIKDLPLPESDYGTYAWADDVDTEIVVNQTGTQTFAAVFTPNDTEKFNILEDLQISVAVKTELSPEYVQIECIGGPYTYNKTGIEPEVNITLLNGANTDGEAAETLIEGMDYELSYENNVNAGTAKVIVSGINSYYGSMEKTFTIEPRELVIRALDKVVTIGDSMSMVTDYEYELEGRIEGDELIKAPEFTCEITSTEEEGEYEIVPKNADAGGNYHIRYENGVLHVVSGLLTCKVIFNMQGHGTAPTGYAGVPVGSTIDRPADPKADGYRFDGWYQDSACTKAWNFETDTMQSDITLYAKWLGIGVDSDLAVQEIADVYYNGKAQKPAVSVYDQDKLLKAGKDYQIKYYNNINANADGVMSKSGEFNDKLPYVEITGKGNYKDSVKINFNILKSPIEDAYGNPASGVTLKVNDHLVKSAKPLTPFGSINYGKKLNADTDYELTLISLNVFDASGGPVSSETYVNAQIPANYTGEFLLTVEGKGNYTGSITRSVYVADKNHLMKNVKITLGKNLKNVEYTGERIEFTPADKQKPGNDEFVVTCGKTVLTPNEDYSVSYNNNTGVGKAELVVVGKGDYVGKKSVTFNIKGKTFSNGTVDVTGLNDKAYTGKAITQNKEAVLKWKADGKALVYGTDYTISYSKNINKGTATVTFTGIAEGGYSGKVSKKFKISAADISDETQVTRAVSMQTITLPYSKAGVKPVDEIVLTSAGGTRLQNGKDYILTYKNNKAVAAASGDKAPTVTVKGKGNYSGSFDVKFAIERADLNGSGIVIECAPVAYNSKKADDYAYKPAIKVKDGKATLKAGKDYEISYVNNTQADYNNYLEKVKPGSVADDDKSVDDGKAANDYIPVAVITGKEGSAYTVQDPIKVPLQIYMTKFTNSNLDVQIDTAVYTGGQVKPNVTVKYKGESGDILLEQGKDYTLEYGANSASGKNKGSVTVKGLAPYYGGSVTYKFEITKKDLKYWNLPEADEK